MKSIAFLSLLIVLVSVPLGAQAKHHHHSHKSKRSSRIQAWPFEPDWEVYQDIPYGPDSEEKADLYLVRGPKRPAVIFIHGGGWSAGDKSSYRGYYAEKFGWKGVSVISINYRLAKMEDPQSQWPAQLQDVQLAVRWVREHHQRLGIDPDRICAFGDSAGGHLALFLGSLEHPRPGDRSEMIANQSPKVSCVVNMFGPGNLAHSEFTKVFVNPPLFGGRTYAEAPDLWQDASPIHVINSRSAPTMMVQGLTDKIVATPIAEELVRVLKEKGVPHRYITFHGGHWFENIQPASAKEHVEDQAYAFALGILKKH